MQRVDLINHPEVKKKMSHETASKAIHEGVMHNKIIREEEIASSGKQKKVFLTVYPDIAKDQKRVLMENEKWLKSFDARFFFFKNKFSSLPIEEKAVGINLFFQLLLHFEVTIQALWANFGKTRKWQTMLDEVTARNGSINNLMKSRSNKERGMIGWALIEGRFFYLGQMMEQMDEYLRDIKNNKFGHK